MSCENETLKYISSEKERQKGTNYHTIMISLIITLALYIQVTCTRLIELKRNMAFRNKQ